MGYEQMENRRDQNEVQERRDTYLEGIATDTTECQTGLGC